MEIIGRENEISRLRQIENSGKAEFVVVYGRRRVGKTFLVNRYFDNKFAFKVTGLAKKDKKAQLANFADALSKYDGTPHRIPDTWMHAFDDLRDLIEKKGSRGRKVIFIDELPWMDTPRGNLISALEHFWNDWGCTRDDIMLIICGSATSWMTRKIIKDHGGLHNRLTGKIYLRQFNLMETKKFLEASHIAFEDKDILECYMIMGGIPYYLAQIERGKSLAQNVDEMFFRRKGKLDGEFENLYASLFENSENYVKVVEVLSKKNKGMTRNEIIEATGLSDGGALTTVLDDLDNCDLIRKYSAFDKQKRQSLYQLTDFYTFFYFKFIRKYGTSDKNFWSFQLNTPVHNAWSGYAFEQLCLCHSGQIEKKLGISGILTKISSWSSIPSKYDRDSLPGAQTDLVISRADLVISVCEMKFWIGPYAISGKYRTELLNKIDRFRRECKIRYPIHLVMVTTYGILENDNSHIVQNEVTMRDLFE